ncbi:MAG: RraA family protein [Anaerolineae bacterium]|nr:RraA family protein [Anaerolineae bacterium]
MKAIDTPTICNAIETFKVRGRIEGFFGMDIKCLFPEMGSMVGYAVTVKVDSTTPNIPRDNDVWKQWVLAMDAAPKPIVLVFQDVGPELRKSAHSGEVMCTLAARLGCVGLVTDGGVRDVNQVREMGFQYFAAGTVASHGNPRLLEVNVPVTLDGVTVNRGDLLHGDINGLTTIPLEIAAQISAEVEQVRNKEQPLINYMKSDNFTVEGLLKRLFEH